MTLAYPQDISDGHGGLVTGSSLPHLAVGTMVSRDLDAARKLYEDFLGFETIRVADDRMLIRDRRSKYMMENGERDWFVIEVHHVENVERPQKMLNHWGISVGSREEVERLHQIIKADKEGWYVKKMRPVLEQHETYGFFFIDQDDNWWEIEFRNGMTNDTIFAKGDYNNRTTDAAKMIDPPIPLADTKPAVLGSESFMTHGTVDVVDVVNTQGFYQQVLGLRSVLRFENSQFTSGGGDFTFVGVQVGEKHVAEQTADNRWILLVDEQELSERHAKALGLKEQFGIRHVTEPTREADGTLSFLIESADSNWFEFSTRSRITYSNPFRAHPRKG